MKEKIVYPEGVVDKKEYVKYLALSNHPLIKNGVIVTSEGEELNIRMMPNVLRDKVKHLPPKEQEAILSQRTQYNTLLGKKSSAKRKAFGTATNYPKGRRTGKNGKRYNVMEKDVIELLGRLFTISEVVRIMGEDYGIEITAELVKKILKENIVEIEKKREEFRNRVTDVRLYNKRPRLEELAWLYGKMKMRYVASNGIEAYNACLRTLEQLRKEAEGDILNVQGAMDINLSVEINAHIQQEILKTINLKEIILGRVAARMSYDPTKLIAGLHNSYYNRFVQISGDYDPKAEIEYPSLINYDFTEIEKRNAEVDDVVEVEAEEVSDSVKTQASIIRNLFLEKIRKQREDMEHRISSFTSAETSDAPEATEDYDEFNRHSVGRGKDKVPPSISKARGERWEKDENGNYKGGK